MRLIIEIGSYNYVMLSKNININEVVKALSEAVVCDKIYVGGKSVFTPNENSRVEAILIQDISESIHPVSPGEASGV